MGWNAHIETWNDEPEAASLPEQRWVLGARYHWIIVEAGNEWLIHVAVAVFVAGKESRGRAQRSRRDRDGNTCGGSWYMWSWI
jgi:hypothetical protein